MAGLFFVFLSAFVLYRDSVVVVVYLPCDGGNISLFIVYYQSYFCVIRKKVTPDNRKLHR